MYLKSRKFICVGFVQLKSTIPFFQTKLLVRAPFVFFWGGGEKIKLQHTKKKEKKMDALLVPFPPPEQEEEEEEKDIERELEQKELEASELDFGAFVEYQAANRQVITVAMLLKEIAELVGQGEPERARKVVDVIWRMYPQCQKDKGCVKKNLSAQEGTLLDQLLALLPEGKEQATEEENYLDSIKPIPHTARFGDSDLQGSEHIKEILLSTFVVSVRFTNLMSPATAVLLYGVPGTGKTQIASALPNLFEDMHISCELFAVPAGNFKSKWFGGTESRLLGVFEKLQNDAEKRGPLARSILFIDEIEAIAGEREGQDNITVVTTLLQLMAGVTKYPQVLVVAATNLPWNIDSAILRRLGNPIFVDLPVADARKSIIEGLILKARNGYLAIEPTQFQRSWFQEGGALEDFIQTLVWLTGNPKFREGPSPKETYPPLKNDKPETKMYATKPAFFDELRKKWTYGLTQAGIKSLIQMILNILGKIIARRSWEMGIAPETVFFTDENFVQFDRTEKKWTITPAFQEAVFEGLESFRNPLNPKQYENMLEYNRTGQRPAS